MRIVSRRVPHIAFAVLSCTVFVRTQTVPDEGLEFDLQGGLDTSNYSVQEIEFAGKPKRPRAAKFEPGAENDGTANLVLEEGEHVAIGYAIDVDAGIQLKGHTNVSGRLETDITAGSGECKMAAKADVTLQYGDTVRSSDAKAIVVATSGMGHIFGTGVTIAGFGISITTTWVEDKSAKLSQEIGDTDSGLWKESDQAQVNINAQVYYRLELQSGAHGLASAEAMGGALVQMRPVPTPDEGR